MLQRMNELAVKGENGTLTTTDRSYIQSEIRQLMSEVDRVQSTTTFNEMNLLDGSFVKGLQVGAEAGQHIDISIKNMSMAGLAAGIANLYTKVTYNNLASADASYTKTSYTATKVGSQQVMIGSVASGSTTKTYTTIDSSTSTYATKEMTSAIASSVVNKFMKLETGASSSVATQQDFNSLNAFVKGALILVSQQRSDLGAIQNRLEHTISNLDNIVENTTSAESAIRDTDIATEMVTYSNNNILQQAGTSMLSQANQSNQLALSLLG
jgi:flagellin